MGLGPRLGLRLGLGLERMEPPSQAECLRSGGAMTWLGLGFGFGLG